ncbi:helix-turn-helix domain-containing protein [Stenotrophomonas maltophilia]|uniref:helix-turn-helix domain-containing protein n=1 Tax=Stenotrophomonas maltophilia TaxID=40324 RepID=UPI001094A7D4|nr:helix-turn-helix domain-containing protein [Stenotrophomonas maltophilia]TGW16866.1 helix-turn-helix domain-containing protein [Stenotrophomonas maltophilia]
MSNKITELCWPLQMPPPAKAVLMAIAWHADDFGMAFPGFTTLIEKTCLSKTALLSAIAWLEDNQVLTIRRGGSDAGGTKYSNRYSLNLSRLDKNAFASKPRRASKPVRQTDRPESGEGVDRSGTHTGTNAEPVRDTDGSEETEGANRYAASTGARERPVRLANSTGTSGGPDRSVSRTQPVRETDPKGHERSLKVIEPSNAQARDDEVVIPQLSVDEVNRELMGIPRLPPGLDPQVLARFVRHRRVLGKPMTISAWLELQPRFRQLTAEGHNLNLSLSQTMRAGLALPVTPKPEGTDHEQHRESVGNRTRRIAEERARRDAAAAAARAVEESRALEHEGPGKALGCDG